MAKHIFIAGGNSGTGLILIKRLIDGGNTITAVSRNGSELHKLEGVTHIQADPADPETELEFKESDQAFDGFVYFPGTISLKPFNRLKINDYEEDYRVNFLGSVNLIKQLLPKLKKGNDPSVVLISTVAVQTGMAFHASISAAKGAIEGFTKALAAEMSPTIRVNAVAPSLTDTPLAERLLNSDAKINSSSERHPLKRVGKPEDQAAMIKFLLSEESSWITGQILHVDGGLSTLR